MSELSDEARVVLDSARKASAPTEADRARIRAALAASLGPSPSPGSAAEPGRVAAGSSAAISGLKLAVAIALVGGMGMGAATWRHFSTRGVPADLSLPAPQAPLQVRVEAPLPAEPPPAPAPERPRARPAPALAPSPRFAPLDLRGEGPSPEPPSPGAPEGGLADELRLLKAAHRSLRSDPSRSLELLEEHARRFPRGALLEERMAARVAALCALRRAEDARRQARELLAENPQSPYAARLREPCAEER